MREMAPEQAGAEKVPFESSVPLEIDDGYSFLDDDSLLFRVGSWLLHWFALVVLAIYNRLFFGLRTVGFENLRGLPQSIITICNHVNMLDCSMVACACFDRKLHFPTLKSNLEIPFIRHLVKYLGGFPIPETTRAFCNFSHKVRDILMNGGSVHFFPEGYLSPYCGEIRPFQRGAFLFAYDCGVPILPFVITYREPSPLRRLLRRCPPLTLQILPPVYPDLGAPRREEIDRLMTVCHDRMAAAGPPPAK